MNPGGTPPTSAAAGRSALVPRRRPRTRWRLVGGGVAAAAAALGIVGLLAVAAWRRSAPPDSGNGGIASASFGWRAVDGLIRRRFPDVPTLSTAELSDWLLADPASGSRPPPRLLDVREPAEYAVSHLSGAQRFAPGGDGGAVPRDWPKDAPIVTYCSVGYRSAAAARRLREAGYTDVRNLRGSAFAWANEGRPMVDGSGQLTTRVHPYDRVWGRLVRPEARWSGMP